MFSVINFYLKNCKDKHCAKDNIYDEQMIKNMFRTFWKLNILKNMYNTEKLQ